RRGSGPHRHPLPPPGAALALPVLAGWIGHLSRGGALALAAGEQGLDRGDTDPFRASWPAAPPSKMAALACDRRPQRGAELRRLRTRRPVRRLLRHPDAA